MRSEPFAAAGRGSRSTDNDEFSFGIEEEFFVADAATGRLLNRGHSTFKAECKATLGGRYASEMLQCQIETTTPILTEPAEAESALRSARADLNEIASRHGLAIAASGTYPLATWNELNLTPRRRYRTIREELQIVGRRNVLCGLHVHVAPPRNASRVDLMNRSLPYLPLLLALSTSSPFWQRHPTGMRGYRLAAYDELPRTGLPAIFRNEGDYQLMLKTLVDSGVIPDGSHIWWAIRPSQRYPTLELRISDACTNVRDALCIAALFRCLIRALWREPSLNAEIAPMTRLLVDENRWRAQRYGISGTYLDVRRAVLRPFAELLSDFLAVIADDAKWFGCTGALGHAHTIASRGTSADQQLAHYEHAVASGKSRMNAVREVCRWIMSATVSDSASSLSSAHDLHEPNAVASPAPSP